MEPVQLLLPLKLGNLFRKMIPYFKSVNIHHWHTLQPAIWTADAIGNSDHIYVTRNDR